MEYINIFRKLEKSNFSSQFKLSNKELKDIEDKNLGAVEKRISRLIKDSGCRGIPKNQAIILLREYIFQQILQSKIKNRRK